MEELFSDIEKRMQGAIASLQTTLAGLRTGRASVSLLDPIKVEAYGSMMPISQVGTVNAPEARLLTVQVWDAGLASQVDKAIRDSGLGLNPIAEGQLIRVPIPDLSQERRQEMAKKVGEYAEQSKVSVRNVRRSGMDAIKKSEKDKEISEDEGRMHTEKIQKMTDDFVKEIDEMASAKSEEILTN